MTAEQLIKKFNDEFGLNPWPKTYEVDAETYANWCQFIFHKAMNSSFKQNMSFGFTIDMISIGFNGGPLCKGIELILVTDDKR